MADLLAERSKAGTALLARPSGTAVVNLPGVLAVAGVRYGTIEGEWR